ncbi:hypothetical protein PEB0150_017600 [Bartonella apis]|uniref:hypothetical protein n=1 Tax=Bartonella apis TaxID=1686310 RepID=UPI0009609061|nr:hypothetical protein [Bartonella apis]OLY45061.1 hypothetical protein PEB0150_017600 [Bartonella apis]
MAKDLYLKVSVRSLNRRPTKEELKTALPAAFIMGFVRCLRDYGNTDERIIELANKGVLDALEDCNAN